MIPFKDWFFRELPELHQETDVNKNGQGEGSLQRYLQVFGLELDEQIMNYVEAFTNIVDLNTTDDKYLPFIADVLGMPPVIGDNDIYRKVLAYAVAIYKIKGTRRSYEVFFNLLGLGVEIVEDLPLVKVTYDMTDKTYDDDPMNHYDSECANCSTYTLNLSWLDGRPDPVPALDDPNIQNIIYFLQPINAKLNP